MIGGSYIILPVLAVLISLSFYFKFKLREDIIDRCFCDEVLMDYEAKKYDEEDIDDEDRIGIFRYNYGMKGLRLNIIQNIKCYYRMVLIITTIEISISIMFNFIGQ
jgi:hypothetical protein